MINCHLAFLITIHTQIHFGRIIILLISDYIFKKKINFTPESHVWFEFIASDTPVIWVGDLRAESNSVAGLCSTFTVIASCLRRYCLQWVKVSQQGCEREIVYTAWSSQTVVFRQLSDSEFCCLHFTNCPNTSPCLETNAIRLRLRRFGFSEVPASLRVLTDSWDCLFTIRSYRIPHLQNVRKILK